nr:Stl1.4 [Starmerella bombicola]
MVTRHAVKYAKAVHEKIPEEHRPHARRTATLGLRGRPLRVAITAAAVTGFSLFGYDQGMMSSIISAKQFTGEFHGLLSSSSEHEAVIQGAVTSCYEIGCFFGALFVLAFGDHMGRKPTILIGCVIFIIGALISTTAYGDHWGLGQFVVGRVTSGVGNGLNTATIPVWQSEMARPERRGILVQMEGSVVAIGTMIAYWFDFGLSFINNSIAWRFPVALQIVFALAVLLATSGLPESSRWLVAKGRHDEARQVIANVNNLPEDHEDVEYILSMQQFDAASAGEQVQFADLFSRGRTSYFQRMVIGASTQIGQQLSGCNAAIYYATVLFEQIFRHSGKSERATRILSLILGAVFSSVYALFTFPAYYLIDALGRRKLFMLGITGQAASFFISFGCLVHDTTQNEKGAAVGLFLFIAFFGMSILGLPWIYPPEINPLKTRTHATAVSTCSNWLFNFAVVMFTPVFISYKNWACYLFFALVNCAWLPIVFFFYPETAGRSLEEIDIIFARAHEENKMPWVVASQMPKLSNDEIRSEAGRLGIGLIDYMKVKGTEEDGNSSSLAGSNGSSAPKRPDSIASSISALSQDGEIRANPANPAPSEA